LFLAVYGVGYFGRLSDSMAMHVADRFEPLDVPHHANYKQLPIWGSKDVQLAKEIKKTQKRRESITCTLAYNPNEKTCKCNMCSSTAYDDNMSTTGPEQLCKVPLTVKDLLEMIGQDTEEHLQIVDRLCELSVAAFDIESRTVPVDHKPPEGFAQEQIATEGRNVPNYVSHVQKPCMLAHWMVCVILSRMTST